MTCTKIIAIFFALCIYHFEVVRENQYKKLLTTLSHYSHTYPLLYGVMSDAGNRSESFKKATIPVLAIPVSLSVLLGHYGMKWIVFPFSERQNRIDDILFLSYTSCANLYLFFGSALQPSTILWARTGKEYFILSI